MPIIVTEHEALKLHVVHFEGRVSFRELCALGALHRERPVWAAADAVHIVAEGADLSDLTSEKLDVLRVHYRALHASLDLFLVRRSAWVCRDTTACSFIEHWLKDRHSLDGQGTEVMLVADLDDAVDLFSDDEIAAIRRGRDFLELARMDDAA